MTERLDYQAREQIAERDKTRTVSPDCRSLFRAHTPPCLSKGIENASLDDRQKAVSKAALPSEDEGDDSEIVISDSDTEVDAKKSADKHFTQKQSSTVDAERSRKRTRQEPPDLVCLSDDEEAWKSPTPPDQWKGSCHMTTPKYVIKARRRAALSRQPTRMALLLDRQQRLAEHELYLEACGNLKNLWSNPFSKDAVTNKVCEQELVALKNALKIAHEHLENGDHQNFFRNESDACKWQEMVTSFERWINECCRFRMDHETTALLKRLENLLPTAASSSSSSAPVPAFDAGLFDSASTQDAGIRQDSPPQEDSPEPKRYCCDDPQQGSNTMYHNRFSYYGPRKSSAIDGAQMRFEADGYKQHFDCSDPTGSKAFNNVGSHKNRDFTGPHMRCGIGDPGRCNNDASAYNAGAPNRVDYPVPRDPSENSDMPLEGVVSTSPNKILPIAGLSKRFSSDGSCKDHAAGNFDN